MARQFKARTAGVRSLTLAARAEFTKETQAAIVADINANQRAKIVSGQTLDIGELTTEAGTYPATETTQATIVSSVQSQADNFVGTVEIAGTEIDGTGSIGGGGGGMGLGI